MNGPHHQKTLTDAPQRISLGPLDLLIDGGDLRDIRLHGIEVLRGISCPIRDRDWGTVAVTTTHQLLEQCGDRLQYLRRFQTLDAGLDCTFSADVTAQSDGIVLTAQISMRAVRDTSVNRAGFTLLHPLEHVAGQALQVIHSDGQTTDTQFPMHIDPAQPVKDITALRHHVNGVSVDIEMTGEVFEMEDQRNWSDASFKTYCRPLARPHPFTISSGETLSQRLRVTLRRAAPAATTAIQGARPLQGRMPDIALAAEPGLCHFDALTRYPVMPVLARVDVNTHPDDLRCLAAFSDDVTLEIVVQDAEAPDATLRTIAKFCTVAGLVPRSVVALPKAYLASHQPGGPWPSPDPASLVPMVRAAFPDARVGGGSLTNFTEFNRCRPDPARVDFVTFGSAAIVHAADDLSVLQTLEALPHIFSSARMIAADRSLRLGLIAIGMRSNPYGSGVAPNPQGLRMPMAMTDPRQSTRFAGSWAVGVLAKAAGQGVESLALAMPDGPLGAITHGQYTPLYHVLRAAASLSRAEVAITEQNGVVSLRPVSGGPTGGIATNLGTMAAVLPQSMRGRVLSAASEAEARQNADWASGPPQTPAGGALRLAPHDIAFLN